MAAAEKPCGRQWRTRLPNFVVIPNGNNGLDVYKQHDKRKQKIKFNRGFNALESLKPTDAVWVHDGPCWVHRAVVTGEVTPLSQAIQIPDGHTFWRNRRHLQLLPEDEGNKEAGT